MRALKVVLAACAAAVVLGVLAIPGQAQQSTRRPPMIRVYSTSGADVINTSTYVEPQINLSENAYVFAVEMDLDGQIQVLHPDFPGLSVKISAHTQLRLPNFFAGFNQAVPEAGVYTSAQFQRYSPYGGYQDTRGTVLALASRAPFNLDPISSGDDWNITALRRLMENRTPLEAINVLANYLGAKGEPIGRDFMRFAGGATNRYAYADYAYYSPCDFYYGSFYGALGFTQTWRDEGWMILRRGGLTLEFFPYPDLDPAESSFGCCLRLDELDRRVFPEAGPATEDRVSAFCQQAGHRGGSGARLPRILIASSATAVEGWPKSRCRAATLPGLC